MIRRSDMPEALRSLARWVHIFGAGGDVADLSTGVLVPSPRVYGWVVRTRGSDVVYGHPAIPWMRKNGFTFSGGKWRYVSALEPASREPVEPHEERFGTQSSGAGAETGGGIETVRGLGAPSRLGAD